MYLLNESTTSLHTTSIVCLTITAILCGILVIICKNPIVSVLFLIGLFVSIALYLMELGINFLGLSYLLVYVGAISILFLFILMLINIRVSEITSSTSNGIALAVFIGTVFLSAVYLAQPLGLVSTIDSISNRQNTIYGLTAIELEDEFNYCLTPYINDLLFFSRYTKVNTPSCGNLVVDNITSPRWDTMLADVSHIEILGNILYTNYPSWLILTTMILLLGMIGAILITIKK